MTELLTSIEDVTRSQPCRVVFSRRGRHAFGGIPAIDYIGCALPIPVHHIFTLDTADRLSPLRFDCARFVPLVYPLAYSEGGGEISYRVLSDNAIEVTHLSEYLETDTPYFQLPCLPQRNARLAPLTYAEQRILGSDIRNWSFFDRRRMTRLWNGSCFRVSGMLEYDSERGSQSCPISRDGSKCSAWRFATFPATTGPFGDIWHEYSSDVWFCFSLCVDCGTIHAFNECT